MAMPPMNMNFKSSSEAKGQASWGDIGFNASDGDYKSSGDVYNFGGAGSSGVKVSTPVVAAVAVVAAVFLWSKK